MRDAKRPSMTHRMPLRLMALASLGVLVACATTRPPPPEFTTFASNVQVARILAAGCPTVTVNQGGMGEGARDLGLSLRSQGFTPEDIAGFRTTLDPGTVRAEINAYLTQNGVDPSNAATVCPAARREIDQRSPIAAFLGAA